MNTSILSGIQNIMGSFVRNIYTDCLTECSRLFSNSPDVVLNLPDQNLSFKGNDSIVHFFDDMQIKRTNNLIDKEIFILNTPAFKINSSECTGTWDAFVYRYKSSAGQVKIEPAFCRFDCDFEIAENKAPLIIRMDWYSLMNWEKWEMDSYSVPGASRQTSLSGIYEINDSDFVLIERTLSRLLHSDFSEADDLFLNADDISFFISPQMAKPICGYENIMNQMNSVLLHENENTQNLFYALYAVNPIITCSSNDTANGKWTGMSFRIRNAETENNQTAVRETGLLDVDFTKLNGRWYISGFEYNVYETFKPVRLSSPFNKNSWRPPVQKLKKTPRPEDIAEIQSIMGQWTSRLKTGRLCEFPELYMSQNPDEVFLWLGEDPERKTYGINDIMSSLKYMDDNYRESKYRTPIIHTAMTPLIEISEDGTYAYGQWLDQCYTDLSQISKDFTLPLTAMMNLCKYQNEFRKENGHWKLVKLTWNAWSALGEIYADPITWSGWVSEKYDGIPWPMPLEKLKI